MTYCWLHTTDTITREEILNNRLKEINFWNLEGVNGFERRPRIAGIYRMYDTKGKLVYIGRSVDVYSRLMSYLSDDMEYPIHIKHRKGRCELKVEKILITAFGKSMPTGTQESAKNNLEIIHKLIPIESLFIALLKPVGNRAKPKRGFIEQKAFDRARESIDYFKSKKEWENVGL